MSNFVCYETYWSKIEATDFMVSRDANNYTLRYKELEKKVVGITATMLTKCLRELERDKLMVQTQHATIPPTVEYSLSKRGQTLIPALVSLYK